MGSFFYHMDIRKIYKTQDNEEIIIPINPRIEYAMFQYQESRLGRCAFASLKTLRISAYWVPNRS